MTEPGRESTAPRPIPLLPSGDPPCVGCSGAGADDLRIALDTLTRKYNDLGQAFGAYLRQIGGGSEGPTRGLEPGSAAEVAAAFAERVERIVGGTETGIGDYPECALIGHRSPNGTERWFCTGVLVHPRVVLTAGHCQLPQAPVNVVALNAHAVNDLDDAEIVGVKRVVVQPDYRLVPGNDISVLVLRREAETTPCPAASEDEVTAASTVTLVGFGNNDANSTKGFGIKREVTVPITALRRAAQGDLDAEEQRWGFESDREFVAGGNGFDSCNGDSGGPAYVDTAQGRRVAGLTSRATAGVMRPCGEGGIYTRVDTQSGFIGDVMSAAGIVDAPV